MIRHIRRLDAFSKNIIIVFVGTSLLNVFSLLYQLFVAHKLAPADFAAFNSLLAIFMILSSPLLTLQTATAKYAAGFNARKQMKKIKGLLSGLLSYTLVIAVASLFIFYFVSLFAMAKLKIDSVACVYILALLLAASWVIPVLSGGLQGLELFKWFAGVSSLTGALKPALAFIFISLGFNIAGALGALLASSVAGLVISYWPLRNFLFFSVKAGQNFQDNDRPNWREFLLYLFPVATSSFCFMILASFDMVLVRYFFLADESGLYSLSQMVGKIFLFLPAAISIVMLPRASGLNTKNIDTVSTLYRSLFYGLILCVIAAIVYNLFPEFILKALTGKVFPESIFLGRLFSISMSFFALLFILINYFLSVKDLRFIKYLVFSTVIQVLGIILFHKSLMQVQFVLCANSILLFCIHLILAYKRQPRQACYALGVE